MADAMALLRPAGLNEKRCIVREDLKLYNNIVTMGTYAGSRAPSKQDIFTALRSCLSDHPTLSIVVQQANTEHPMLHKPKTIDLMNHVDFLTSLSSDLQSIVSQIHNEPLVNSSGEPQWRLVVVDLETGDGLLMETTKFHVAFACSHALMDGMSGYAFHRSFQRSLQSTAPGLKNANPTFQVPQDLRIMPPMDSRLSISWSYLLGPVIKEYFPKPLAQLLGFTPDTTTTAWLGARSRPDHASNPGFPLTSVHIASIPSHTLKLTLAQCRIHSTRLTALLHHLFARSLTRSLSKRGQVHNTFVAQTAIDLRKALQQGSNQMAVYVSAVTETITTENTDHLSPAEWDSARQLTQELARASSTLSDHAVGLLKYLSNFRAWTIRNSESRADMSFEISNLGVFTGGEERGEFKVEEMVFSQCANGTGPPFTVNLASTKNGALMMSVTWWNGMLGVEDERPFIEEVCQGVVREAEVIAKQ